MSQFEWQCSKCMTARPYDEKTEKCPCGENSMKVDRVIEHKRWAESEEGKRAIRSAQGLE